LKNQTQTGNAVLKITRIGKRTKKNKEPDSPVEPLFERGQKVLEKTREQKQKNTTAFVIIFVDVRLVENQ